MADQWSFYFKFFQDILIFMDHEIEDYDEEAHRKLITLETDY